MVDPNRQIHFLDVLRGAAAWLVVWDHLFVVYPEHHGITLPVAHVVNRTINEPLGLIQHFGWFGVCLFFLISGFMITHVSLREQAAEFVVKRVFRIFPILALAVLVAIALDDSLRAQATPLTVATNLALVNYWIHPQVILVGVAWTLAIEILFYFWIAASYPLKDWPATRCALLLLVVIGIVAVSRMFGPSFFLFAASNAYLPYLAVGQVLYLSLYQRAIGAMAALGLLALAYAALLFGLRSIHVKFLPIDNSYLVSFVFALAVFLFGWALNDRLRPGRVTRLLADTSYSVYLFHGIVGFFLLGRLIPSAGIGLALTVTVPAMFAFVLLVHHTIEKPMLNAGRWLARRVARRHRTTAGQVGEALEPRRPAS